MLFTKMSLFAPTEEKSKLGDDGIRNIAYWYFPSMTYAFGLHTTRNRRKLSSLLKKQKTIVKS
jgi:hypothetical protein